MKSIQIIQGDITEQHVDAIVNAANKTLLSGSGVNGAIHEKGGRSIAEACARIRLKQGECPIGDAVVTTAGNMPSTYVIHTVGPVWQGGQENEEALLQSAYEHSLQLAESLKLETMAIPNISTGTHQFPKIRAAEIALETVVNFLKTSENLQEVIFVCFDDENYQIYRNRSLSSSQQAQANIRLVENEN